MRRSALLFFAFAAFSCNKEKSEGPAVSYPYEHVYVGHYSHSLPTGGGSGTDTVIVTYESKDSFSILTTLNLGMPELVRFPNTGDTNYYISSPSTMSSGMFAFHDQDSLYIDRSMYFGGGYSEVYRFDGKRQ